MKVFRRKWLMVSALGGALALATIWWQIFRGETMPFSTIRWQAGLPWVEEDRQWVPLKSVSGIPVDSLVRTAVEHWGPTYQHHFGMQLPGLLESMGQAPGWWTDYEVLDQGRVRKVRAFNTRRRHKRFLASLEADTLPTAHVPPGTGLPLLDQKRETPGREWLSGPEARQDLRILWQLLQDHYAFREALPGLDPGFTALYRSAEPGISRRDLALQMQVLLHRLEDIHCRIAFSGSEINLPGKVLPLSLRRSEGITWALDPEGESLLDPDFPLLAAIQGIPVDSLWRRAEQLGGDPARWMERIGLVLALHGPTLSWPLRVGLRSMEGKEKTLSLGPELIPGARAMEFRVEGHMLEGRIGHLRLRHGLYADPGYQPEIIQAMYGLQAARGMVLDLRGNVGGKRDAIPLLLDYFMPRGAHPLIVNLASYRMDRDRRPPQAADILEERSLFPADWEGWSASQRAVLANRHRFGVDNGRADSSRFSALYYMLTDTAMPEGAFAFEQPLVVLIDGHTASATELLLVQLKGNPRVTVMGSRSTGGSGYPIRFQLPNSRIRLDISTMRSYAPDGRLITRTSPDIGFKPDLDEQMEMLRDGTDPLLERARLFLLARDSLSGSE